MAGNPKKRFGGKLYTRSSQGWPNKQDALRAAKSQRAIGYKSRVHFDGKWWRIYWRE